MLDRKALHKTLRELGLNAWREVVDASLDARFNDAGHGDFADWRQALEDLQQADNTASRRSELLKLAPWRKGPFDVGAGTSRGSVCVLPSTRCMGAMCWMSVAATAITPCRCGPQVPAASSASIQRCCT